MPLAACRDTSCAGDLSALERLQVRRGVLVTMLTDKRRTRRTGVGVVSRQRWKRVVIEVRVDRSRGWGRVRHAVDPVVAETEEDLVDRDAALVVWVAL